MTVHVQFSPLLGRGTHVFGSSLYCTPSLFARFFIRYCLALYRPYDPAVAHLCVYFGVSFVSPSLLPLSSRKPHLRSVCAVSFLKTILVLLFPHF
jgi:hypothetical protein